MYDSQDLNGNGYEHEFCEEAEACESVLVYTGVYSRHRDYASQVRTFHQQQTQGRAP